jgi:hypothetical protein
VRAGEHKGIGYMRTMKYYLLAGVAVGALAGLGVYRAADAEVKDIETIMDKAHKPQQSSLYKQVVAGKASKEQQKELLALYTDLGKNKPPKGSAAEWKKRTDALVAATKDVIDGKPDATKALAKAASCSKCHEAHKGE